MLKLKRLRAIVPREYDDKQYKTIRSFFHKRSSLRRQLTPSGDNKETLRHYGSGGSRNLTGEHLQKMHDIVRAHKAPKDLTIYRGIRSHRVPTESTTKMPIFMSGSFSHRAASKFTDSPYDRPRPAHTLTNKPGSLGKGEEGEQHIMKMRVPKGSSIAHIEKHKDVSSQSWAGYQDEVVLRPGKFHLRKVEKQNKRTIYHGDYEEDK